MIGQTDGSGLDGNPAFPLQIHVVEDLLRHIPAFYRAADLDQAVRKGGFAVVDVRDDGEIPDMILWYHFVAPP
jgi:hypothetical protein